MIITCTGLYFDSIILTKAKIFYDFLNWLGISISDSRSPLFNCGYYFLVLSVICLICAVNILVSLIVNKKLNIRMCSIQSLI